MVELQQRLASLQNQTADHVGEKLISHSYQSIMRGKSSVSYSGTLDRRIGDLYQLQERVLAESEEWRAESAACAPPWLKQHV